MVYCMSDIHGEYDRYQEMLQRIDFSSQDTLYMIGDAIDRGSRGVDVVLDLMNRRNVMFLRGNHEQMCLDDLYWRKWNARTCWQMNGGGATRRELLYRQSRDTRESILEFFRNAPTCADLEVHGRKFHLVHGLPGDDPHERLWGRPEPGTKSPIQGVTVVVGHTPTVLLTGMEGSPYGIWHGNGIIDIDCGCGSRSEFRRLACLRLDDMAEFYV